ncbi:MAG: hypothetical protein IJX91_05215 [Clostridia bacterium]|nr:hypothetical protein [Clostridia bacterium]
MTTPNVSSVVYDVDPIVVGPDGLPVTPSELPAPEAEQPVPKKKNVLARIFCAILVIVSVVVLFLPIQVVKGLEGAKSTLFSLAGDLFKDGTSKLFGFLPTFADTSSVIGQLAAISFYVFLLMLVLTVVFGIVGIFCSKKAPCMLRTVLCFFTLGFAVYTVTTLAVNYAAKGIVLDLIPVALTAVGMILCLILGVAKLGKKGWVNFVQFILSLAVVAALILVLVKENAGFNAGLESLKLGSAANIVTLVLFAVAVLNLLFAIVSIQTGGVAFDIVRYVIMLVIGAAVCYLAIASKAEGKLFLILAIVVAAASLVQLILAIVQGKVSNKAVVEEAPVEETPAEEEFVREEFAEALPYEGGPVDGVEIAKEVTPTFTAPPAQVQTAGYDFYNCKSFDPFIAILNNEERNQFTELFILKFKGTMPEIPDYQVGGDNKEFFRKLFIYLGQYRDRIPDSLLAKIYQFAIKM